MGGTDKHPSLDKQPNWVANIIFSQTMWLYTKICILISAAINLLFLSVVGKKTNCPKCFKRLRSFAKPARDPRYYFFHNNPIQVKILLIYARVMRAACSRTRVPSEPGSVWQLRPVWHTRVRSLIANGVPCFFRYMVIFIYIYIPGIILKIFVLSKNPISVFIVTHA